jgi:hypothetical protein
MHNKQRVKRYLFGTMLDFSLVQIAPLNVTDLSKEVDK